MAQVSYAGYGTKCLAPQNHVSILQLCGTGHGEGSGGRSTEVRGNAGGSAGGAVTQRGRSIPAES